MKLFRKLFAEKILRYYEGTEAGIKMIKSFPVIRKQKAGLSLELWHRYLCLHGNL